jgi:hypothetical protein
VAFQKLAVLYGYEEEEEEPHIHCKKEKKAEGEGKKKGGTHAAHTMTTARK